MAARLSGHRDSPLGRSPFGDTRPFVVAGLAYAVAAWVWVVSGAVLPGGRWMAVHLFTLGVLTNLVLGFSQHFGRTLTRTKATPWRWALPVANSGALLVLWGLPGGRGWAVGGGATVLTVVVVASYVRLRRMRKSALSARFGWIVRAYERAHSAFIHGALLGLLMGVGVMSGSWYSAAKLAHLHVNVLGWGGLTLLATLVFFGPTMARTRIEEGADDRAAVALRRGAVGLSVGFWLLLLNGFAGVPGTVLRLASAAALTVHAVAVTVVCRPVARAARDAHFSANRWPVVGVSLWFPVVVWADVGVVASGRWDLLDPVGLAMFTGVLGQAFTAVLSYLAPMLRGRTFRDRDVLLARFERAASIRAAAFNLGVVAVVAGALLGGGLGDGLGRVGWTGLATVVLWLLVAGLASIRHAGDADAVVSTAANRYRS